jgi:alpha-glucuronidase
MLGRRPANSTATGTGKTVVVRVTPNGLAAGELAWPPVPADEGYNISVDGGGAVTISSASEQGALYGAYRFLLLVRRESHQLWSAGVVECSTPNAPLRMWNAWDNADGSVERGYAGPWAHRYGSTTQSSIIYPLGTGALPARLFDFARLLASVGINGFVLNNVNACSKGNRELLSKESVAQLAPFVSALYAHGVHAFLTPCFDSPKELGGLKAAPVAPAGRRTSPSLTHLPARRRPTQRTRRSPSGGATRWRASPPRGRRAPSAASSSRGTRRASPAPRSTD